MATEANVPTKEAVKADADLLFSRAPETPVSDKPIEVCIVAKRCVYLNDYRIAGRKPYVSENLSSHNLSSSLGEVLSAFSEPDVLAALAERKRRSEYFAAYHAQPELASKA